MWHLVRMSVVPLSEQKLTILLLVWTSSPIDLVKDLTLGRFHLLTEVIISFLVNHATMLQQGVNFRINTLIGLNTYYISVLEIFSIVNVINILLRCIYS